MNSDDCVFAYDRLASLLREHRYSWILAQVEATIALGSIRSGRAVDYDVDPQTKISEEFQAYKVVSSPFLQITGLEEEEVLQASSVRATPKRPRRGRPIEIQKVEDFTPVEKLRMLLVATSRVFGGVPEMESSTASVLKEISPGLQAILIEDSRSDEADSIDLLAGEERRSHAAPIKKGLDRLKEMVD